MHVMCVSHVNCCCETYVYKSHHSVPTHLNLHIPMYLLCINNTTLALNSALWYNCNTSFPYEWSIQCASLLAACTGWVFYLDCNVSYFVVFINGVLLSALGVAVVATRVMVVIWHLLTSLSAGYLVPRSVKRVTLQYIPLDLVCDGVKFFEHAEELYCQYIKAPQQVCLCMVLLLTNKALFKSFECSSSSEGWPHVWVGFIIVFCIPFGTCRLHGTLLILGLLWGNRFISVTSSHEQSHFKQLYNIYYYVCTCGLMFVWSFTVWADYFFSITQLNGCI